MATPVVSMPWAFRLAAATAIVGLLLFSARFVTTFPTRISVLPNLQVDASTYDGIALELSNSRSLDAIPPLQPPGFVLFLGMVFSAVGHSWIAARLALWGCLVIATFLSALAARDIYRRESAAWLAGLVCAASPALRGYAGTLQYELLAAVLLLLLILATYRIAHAASVARWRHLGSTALLGVGIGIAILTREVFVAVVPVIGLYLYARRAVIDNRYWAVVTTLICLACAAGPPLAWSGIQSVHTGRMVTVSDKGPLVMAFGNNPLANGTFNAPLVGVGEPQGWSFITANPRDAAWLAIRKAMYFWGLLRDGWNVPRPSAVVLANATAGAIPLQWILPWVRGGWLLVAFLAALFSWRRDTWGTWWFVPAIVLVVMAVHVVSISSYRFAIPTLPVVMALAAGPLDRLIAAISKRQGIRVMVVVVLLCSMLMQTRSWPLVYELAGAELDGVAADNRLDERMAEKVRFADASRGRRTVLLLTDEYLPAGELTIRIRVRTDNPNVRPEQPLFIVRMNTMSGAAICEHVVNAGQVAAGGQSVDLPCSLVDGSVSTFLVETLGTADLVFGSVRFAWRTPGLKPRP